MRRNSTLKLWDLLLKEKYSDFDRSVNDILCVKQFELKEQTINNILAYAKSVRGINMKKKDTILISLN